jgi:predicted dienelactone hydrolase
MDTAQYIQDPEAYGYSAGLSRSVHLKTNSLLAAPLSDSSPKYPVLLFSHGKDATRFCCTFLMEHLASYGYIIFSIGHTFFNGVEVFPDGYRAVQDYFPNMPESESQDEGYRKFSEYIQQYTLDPLAEDTQFVLNQIERINRETGGFFQERLDLDRMGICGWSIGGVNAAQMCNRDRKLKAGINFDGTLNEIIAQQGVKKPFMLLKSEPQVPENPDDEFKKMVSRISQYESDFISHSTNVYRIIISGAKHINFSDQPLYNANATGSINAKRCHEIIAKLTKAFFDCYVLGNDEIDLGRLAEPYPAVRFTRY